MNSCVKLYLYLTFPFDLYLVLPPEITPAYVTLWCFSHCMFLSLPYVISLFCFILVTSYVFFAALQTLQAGYNPCESGALWPEHTGYIHHQVISVFLSVCFPCFLFSALNVSVCTVLLNDWDGCAIVWFTPTLCFLLSVGVGGRVCAWVGMWWRRFKCGVVEVRVLAWASTSMWWRGWGLSLCLARLFPFNNSRLPCFLSLTFPHLFMVFHFSHSSQYPPTYSHVTHSRPYPPTSTNSSLHCSFPTCIHWGPSTSPTVCQIHPCHLTPNTLPNFHTSPLNVRRSSQILPLRPPSLYPLPFFLTLSFISHPKLLQPQMPCALTNIIFWTSRTMHYPSSQRFHCRLISEAQICVKEMAR